MLLADKTLFTKMSGIGRLRMTLDFFATLKLEGANGQVAERIVREIANRLEFLVDVGLDYLALDRARPSRSPAASRSASASRARSARA